MSAAEPTFVSIAQLLRGTLVVHEPEPLAPATVTAAGVHVDEPAYEPADVVAAQADLLREIRVFRARLADAFDTARATLIREFAYAVLGRELLLAPADVATIAQRIIAEHPAAQPLCVRVAPADMPTRSAPAPLSSQAQSRDSHAREVLPPIVADATLAPGDAVLELACGHIDARLGVRIAALLDRSI